MQKKMTKNTVRTITLIILGFVSVNSAFSQVKYSNEFLAIGVGARGLAMSRAQVATVSDVTSGYWNPAGLNGITNRSQVSLMHAEYFAGIAKYDYGAFAKRIDSNSVFGISVIRFGVDDIPNTTELIDNNGNVNYDRITKFSAADYAFVGSYARKLKPKGLTFGVNAKVIHRIIGDFAKSWGFGLDAGLQYNRKNWKLGLMAKDVTSTFNAWSYNLSDKMKEVFIATGNEIPQNSLEVALPRFIGGIGRNVNFSKKISLLAEVNFEMTTDGMRNVLIRGNHLSIDPYAGLEFSFAKIIFLRGGVGNIQKSTDIFGKTITTYQPNFGVGVKIKWISLDYALTDIGDQSVALYSNVFSLKFDINRKLKNVSNNQ